MPTNLELKIKVTSHQSIKKILAQIGAENKGMLKQKDVYYSIPNGLLKLRIENGNESLIFYNRNENNKNRWSDFEFLKFTNSNGEKFFSNLFDVEVIVKKKRELFYYDDTRIHLDKVNNLGKFLELETLVINGKVDAKKRFAKTISLLKLDESKQIRKSYRDLLMGGTREK
jgi:adenylate cyclase class 2